MWEPHAVSDCFLKFVALPHHVLFFYINLLPESPEREGAAETEELEPATMLQRAVRAQKPYDAGARSMTERLHAVFSALGPKIQSFVYTIHPMFIQNTSVFVPLTYLSPAIPMFSEFASVCTAWRDSLMRILKGCFLLNPHR